MGILYVYIYVYVCDGFNVIELLCYHLHHKSSHVKALESDWKRNKSGLNWMILTPLTEYFVHFILQCGINNVEEKARRRRRRIYSYKSINVSMSILCDECAVPFLSIKTFELNGIRNWWKIGNLRRFHIYFIFWLGFSRKKLKFLLNHSCNFVWSRELVKVIGFVSQNMKPPKTEIRQCAYPTK